MSYSDDLANAFGFLLPGEVDALKRLASRTPKNGVIVNIGAGAGTSSLAIAEVRPNATRYTIDISEGGPLGGFQNEKNAFAVARHLELPIQLLGDSKQIGLEWDKGEIDFLFIDGDHSEAGASGDILNWLHHIKKGGIIALHDYDAIHWPDVKRVVDKLLGDKEMIEYTRTVIGFIV